MKLPRPARRAARANPKEPRGPRASAVPDSGPSQGTPGRFAEARLRSFPVALMAGVVRVIAGRVWPPALVAAGFTVAQMVLVGPGMGLAWDETVYVSQVSPKVPAAFFSAPRARGISVLVAPVVALTSSTAALRLCLAILSGAGLLTALWAWRSSRPAWVLALAGSLFAGLWITLFYGPQAMPNLWVALGGLAAVGCFLRVAAGGSRGALGGLATGLAVAAFMRPADAAWLALPMLACIPVAGRRRWGLLGAVAGGLLAGGAEWVAEAQLRYGGVLARLHRASQIEGGIGWHIALGDQLRALDGRTLCRPCTVPWQHPITSVWWLALPVLAAVGVIVAARARRRRLDAYLPAMCALTVAVPYLLLIDYAAPRFLLPSYALLAIPVADALAWMVHRTSPRWRPVTLSAIIVCLAGHLAIQQQILTHTVARTRTTGNDYARAAADLDRLGIRPPCLITGDQSIPIAFYARCASAQTSGNNANITATGIRAETGHRPVALVLAHGERPPGYARGWLARPLPGLKSLTGYLVYLPSETSPPDGQAHFDYPRPNQNR